ncbi:MAG: protein-tyrosine-phosphatase [Lachnospiraceae bacterium]|nr:protein-tyrosine-phosphatase [Lachnospiraceae bacterium]
MGNKYQVDMHCHILPGIDDGSQSMKTTIKMLRIAAQCGTTHMVATPHFKKGHHNASPETIKHLIEEVQGIAAEKNIDVKIFPGNEIMFFSDLEEAFDAHRIQTMNGTEYLLVEFYPDEDFARIRRGMETVQSLGLHPVLAHVERFLALRKDIGLVEELKDMGCLIQTNASSVTGGQGFKTKQFVKKLLKNEIIDLVGTDAHHYETRTPEMGKCAEYLYKKFDEDYADRILFKNAIEYFGLTQ